MHLSEILVSCTRPNVSWDRPAVPDWMIGSFKRRFITYADGLTDVDMEVYWLQSRRFSIDLRLARVDDQLPACHMDKADPAMREALAQHQGWFAESHWDEVQQQLSWQAATSLQLHDLWPEPAILRRVGNCMIEFAPSGVLIEDWRLQNLRTGPLIGLQLLGEYDSTGTLLRTGGGLIINDGSAAMVTGRTRHEQDRINALSLAYEREHHIPATLPRLMQTDGLDIANRRALMGCETSLAMGSLVAGYTVTRSTHPDRLGASLLWLDGFNWDADGHLIQALTVDGQPYTRVYAVDVLEAAFPYPQSTATTAKATDWMQAESVWRSRYTETVL